MNEENTDDRPGSPVPSPIDPGPGVARAQNIAEDLTYCAKLSDIYERYIGGSEFGPRQAQPTGDLAAKVAVAQCRQGDPSGIRVLEQSLQVNGFTLPRR